ncbi:MAG: hypothetical protein JRN09_09215 [Nitrososphaerota archaeon]|nr:hypothetical protein [Nitrososphaerota archaeon]
MDLRRYLPDISSSGLYWVIAGFSLISVLNVLTLVLGRDEVLAYFNSNPLGPVLAVVVFDTPWTVAGLLGLVVLFTPVLFGTPVSQRRSVSLFFLSSSVIVGVTAGVVWDRYFDNAGVVGAGSSGIAIAGQSVVFCLALFGLFRLQRQDTRSLGRMSSYWWHAFAAIYGTLVLTTLLFVVVLQPIFTPTLQYNWRVHEFAFLIAIGVTVVYEGATWSAQGLDGKLRVDEMLLNYHFDDLNDRFVRPLPKLRVVFAETAEGISSDFHPETGEIWVSPRFCGLEYFRSAKEVDDALLHGMLHADLYYSGRPWQHGLPEAAKEFDSDAEGVGASPEHS